VRRAILVLAMGSLAVATACDACKHGRQDKGRQGEARQPTIVTGRFVLSHGASHTSPDGDTVRFVPDRGDPLCSRRPCPHGVNVRVASVDALELHYECGHQDLELATRARDRLLELLGFTSVEYRPTRNGTSEVVRSVPAEVRGYLVARDLTRRESGSSVTSIPGNRPCPTGAPSR
jgi:hypothetical protein